MTKCSYFKGNGILPYNGIFSTMLEYQIRNTYATNGMWDIYACIYIYTAMFHLIIVLFY